MAEEKKGFFQKLIEGLTKTRDSFVKNMDYVFRGFTNIDEEFYEELEEILISGDIGVRTTEEILDDLKAKVKEVRPLPEPIEDIDQSSFDDLIVRLKACRIKLAGREHMPAYIVCDDKTLREIARVRPRNLQAFSGIKGIGEIKVQKYGQAFIDAIDEWSRVHPEATINTESDEKVFAEQKDPLRPMTGSERDLLERCLKADLTVEQIAVFMDQPVTVISNWLKSVK